MRSLRRFWDRPVRFWHTCSSRWLDVVLLVSGAPVIWWSWTTSGWMPLAVLVVMLVMHEQGRRLGVWQGIDLVKQRVTAVLERRPNT